MKLLLDENLSPALVLSVGNAGTAVIGRLLRDRVDDLGRFDQDQSASLLIVDLLAE